MKIKKNKHKFRHGEEKKVKQEQKTTNEPSTQLKEAIGGGVVQTPTTQAIINSGLEDRFKKRHQEGGRHHHHF